MKDVLEKIFEHPFGAAFLTATVATGVVRIVYAVKGIKPPQAVVNVTNSKTASE